jgi:hypothetical protein
MSLSKSCRLLAALLWAPVSVACGQRITPTFAWPVGVSATIQSTTMNVRRSDGMMASQAPNDSSEARSSIPLLVTAAGNDVRIAYGPMKLESGAPFPGATGAQSDIAQQVRTVYVVSRAGAFLRLDDTVQAKRNMDSLLSASVAKVGSSPAAAEAFKEMSSVRFLADMASQSWAAMQGDFVGRSWSPGDTIMRTVSQRVPMPGNPTLDIQRIVKYEGLAPCPDAAGAPQCWRFSSAQDISREAMREFLGKMLAQQGMSDLSMLDKVPMPVTTTRSVILLDPATGNPLESTLESVVSTSASEMGSFIQRMRMTLRYRWGK